MDIVEANDQTQIMRGKRSKRSRLSVTTNSSAASGCSFYDNSEEDEDMANCLIMLAQSGRFQKPKIKVQKPEFYVYECKTCNRSFPSFQALGGHRASHKKHKTAQEKQIVICQDLQDGESHLVSLRNPGPKVHECSICGSEFASGQALGGHMRRHRSTSTTPNATTQTNIVTSDDNTENVMQLDLNLPAPEDHRQDSKFRILDFNLAPALVDCRY